MQSVTSVAAGGELLFTRHATHAALPLAFLYMPASHAAQNPPSAPW